MLMNLTAPSILQLSVSQRLVRFSTVIQTGIGPAETKVSWVFLSTQLSDFSLEGSASETTSLSSVFFKPPIFLVRWQLTFS